MKSYQILALVTLGSCALITADSGLLRASNGLVVDSAEQQFALLDEQEKNRMLGGYTEDDNYDGGDEDDDEEDMGGKGK